MIKVILVIISSVLIVACGSQPSKTTMIPGVLFNHPKYGVVELPDEAYSSDLDSCEIRVFKGGVLIDGKNEIDPEIIRTYQSEAFVLSIEKEVSELTKSMEAMGFELPSLTSPIEPNIRKPPQYYAEADRVKKEVDVCMSAKGWSEAQHLY